MKPDIRLAGYRIKKPDFRYNPTLSLKVLFIDFTWGSAELSPAQEYGLLEAFFIFESLKLCHGSVQNVLLARVTAYDRSQIKRGGNREIKNEKPHSWSKNDEQSL